MNELSRLGDVMAPKPEVTNETLLSALQFWVDEASAAIKAAAFVRGYVIVQTEYLESKKQQGSEPSNPQYSPVARVAYGRLYATSRELVLFSTRAVHDQEGYGLREIKNDLFRLLGCDATKELGDLKENFRAFDKQNNQQLLEIVKLRKKAMAHSDWETVFGKLDSTTKVSEIVKLAEEVIELLRKLCFTFSKTRALTFEECCSLYMLHEKIAATDAVDFWKHNFGVWAK